MSAAVRMLPVASKETGPIKLREYRCACGKLLIRAELKSGSAVEAYCRDCKKHTTFIAA